MIDDEEVYRKQIENYKRAHSSFYNKILKALESSRESEMPTEDIILSLLQDAIVPLLIDISNKPR